ncbi:MULTISPECIES: head maturation protease, ClpP-related [Brucella/Ochrobactrum group]|uniref:head maturation protease, ClpP-related n=1 Tax=Brucella/Ochrobactrum group TaxID=2826938 RepID=UPI00124F029E|nr:MULTISPECIES: head maturation protease, ClpP-related [Brucella/Ochrobactrum group]KAB2764781.1 Clp protease ClpP [Brucella anthropi]MCQ9143327.1 Clp protease ClpP [Ochrobactrum sp. BTU2]UGQ23862.1 Clp protease ClpP [Brucella anthropi]
MTMRNLPSAKVNARPGLRSEMAPSALDRWNSGVKAASEDDNTISILDPIGEDWYGNGVTSKRVSAALRAIGKKDVTVSINSPGGDYFEGLAIYNLLRDHPAKVTVKIVGIAASAASVIAMAADEVQIARAGFIMIHNTWVVGAGDRHALRDIADWLEPFDMTAIDIYAARTGLDEKDIAGMLDRETWIGGADAVDRGFADSLLSADEIESRAAQSHDERPKAAAHKLDTLLARLNVPRSERRELIQALKGGKPSATAAGMQDAAVISEVSNLLASLKSI